MCIYIYIYIIHDTYYVLSIRRCRGSPDASRAEASTETTSLRRVLIALIVSTKFQYTKITCGPVASHIKAVELCAATHVEVPCCCSHRLDHARHLHSFLGVDRKGMSYNRVPEESRRLT